MSVPHDWAIAGPFARNNDLQFTAIFEDGDKKAEEMAGRTGALPWVGEGHYRRTIHIDSGARRAELVFDGAMAEPTVTVNERKAGYWAYGFNTFRIDITPYVKPGVNTLEVDLVNLPNSGRWYHGGGIYRPVRLVTTQAEYIDDWSVFARTIAIDGGEARIAVDAKAMGLGAVGDVTVEFRMTAPGGDVAAAACASPAADGSVSAELTVPDARLWSPESPNLYNLQICMRRGGKMTDRVTVRTGIRMVAVSRDGGFQLNGQRRKIRGVCLHHDLGPLGAALNKAALIRQIRIMKEMGADAIRTSHNPPSQWQMDVCDSMGMMVMAESFDMWIYPKCRNGYARFFEEWSDRDMTNILLAHRNHPCIVMWSIGNEIREQATRRGVEILHRLQNLCHRLDPTRPVTCGMNRHNTALQSGFAQQLDLPGFNYGLGRYENDIKQLPQGFLIGAETASTVSSRGVYKFPAVTGRNKTYDDRQCSSYDLEYCSWSNLPDDDWVWQDDKDWVLGEFVWTGFDYLGEPTPYKTQWPSRSSYFGIVDLAGLPKDRYWLYRSRWRRDSHTTHLLPHWTWPGREGEVTPVYCYTDGVEAELFVNGKSQGRIRKNPSSRLDRYRLRWNDVRYEPGMIEVVAYDSLGRETGRDIRRTAGEAVRITAAPDRDTLVADGNDMAFVTVRLVDSKGTMLPAATDSLEFSVERAGVFQAACNGDATSLEPFVKPAMRLFSGQLVVVVRSAESPGPIALRIKDRSRNLETVCNLKSIVHE